ncbi:hypothetical protein ACFOYW_12630 [Gryllotalpicola reticulitermitis]|uniref:Uncharacterized protein n=1 Tax=Gryllotalpicola reticulitermitis TaxID=1184153 RepID=A0ABV8Q9T6_9MICO
MMRWPAPEEVRAAEVRVCCDAAGADASDIRGVRFPVIKLR